MARDLGDDEKEMWRKVIESITPLSDNKKMHVIARTKARDASFEHSVQPIDHEPIHNTANPTREDLARALTKPIKIVSSAKPINRFDNQDMIHIRQKPLHNGLDGHWEKRLNKGAVIPDISIDLHGAGLQSAYDRLDGALEQARVQKLRVILLVTGRQRQYDRASGEGRGGIRAVMRDWLSASRHSDYIASVRSAHPRHGGAGALYIILRKDNVSRLRN